METQDTRSPYVEHKGLKVIYISENSFSIRWEKAKDKVTPAWGIRYVVGLKETDNKNDTWHIVAEEKDMDTFTFKGLKRYTRYSCYVRAYDEAGNMTQYPGLDSFITVTTRWIDSGPTVQNSKIKLVDAKQHSLSIQWEKAADDFSKPENILYYILIAEIKEDEKKHWLIVHEEKGICSYTFTGLKTNTGYSIQIWASDEAGYAMVYPEYEVWTDDYESPVIRNKSIEVTEVKAHSISIKWEKATDNETRQKDLLYEIVLKEADDDPHKPATIVYEEKGICAYTIRDLKSNTAYFIDVRVVDEDHIVKHYSETRDGITVTTLEDKSGDTLAPTVRDSQLRVVDKTNHSVTIRWDRATDDTTNYSNIQYLVWIHKAGTRDMWRIDHEGKAFDMHTFQNLEPDTAYSILVMAYDENGNVLRYPGPDAYLTVTTKKGDNQAPTTPSKHLIVMDVTETSIAIEWEPAKDDVTQDEDIRYVVALTKADDKEDPWRIVHQGTGLRKYTFKDLKPGTRYSFFVMAFDEAGNMIQYPGLDRSVTVKTLSW